MDQESLDEMNATNKTLHYFLNQNDPHYTEVPEFTTEQRTQYFTLTEKELALALGRKRSFGSDILYFATGLL